MAQIQVTVVEGKDLKKKDLFSESDAFVEIYFDHHNQKQRTKVQRNSKNPQWNEILVFSHIPGHDTLQVDVYDEDMLKNDQIGSTTIDLQGLEETKSFDRWYSIQSRFRGSFCGEIHLIIEYQPLKV